MPTFIVVILWIFCALVLLFIFGSFIKSMCNGSPRPRTSTANAAAAASTSAAASVAGTADANARNVLSALPVFAYSAAAQKTKLNCSVCLNDFKEGEKGRFLPRCFHCFHVECVDEWLASHLECPVCRASIDPEAGELPV